jgi:hypothetical protein
MRNWIVFVQLRIAGLTPSTATSGAVTLAGTLVAANGGTGQSSYTVGDILYASTTTALSKLAGVATGNALISGGVGAAPSWGKIDLTTTVTGILPGANGGTGNGFFAVSGPATSLKTFTFPNASATVLTDNALVTVAQGGTGVGTLSGLAYGNGTSAFTAATAAQVVSVIGTTAVTNATNAVNTGTTDDTTTATAVYPVWKTSTSGNLPEKTSSTKLSFVPSTGVLSATGFSGSGSSLTGIPTSIVAGTGISVSGATGAVTITNTSPGVTYTGGTGISVAGTTITNTGVTSVTAGSGISVSASTGGVTITNTSSVSSSQLAQLWCNWNSGAGVRASYNVSSVSRNGTGDWTVNFAITLTDGNYAIGAVGGDYAGGDVICLGVFSAGSQTSTSVRMLSGLTGGGGRRDSNVQCITVFR